MSRVLPGAVTVLVPNPAGRFPLACGTDVATLGIRVPVVPSLEGVRRPVLQSSANRAGGPDPRRLEDVPELLRAAVDLVIDGGELPGTPSTVVDLRRYEADGEWSVVRAGAVGERELTEALHWQYHFDASTYTEAVRSDVPGYDLFQDSVAAATGTGARRILDLGTGTGETARRVLARHPGAIAGRDRRERGDAGGGACRSCPASGSRCASAGSRSRCPEGSFDLVTSALCVHHLDGAGKADLFRRVHAALDPGGLFVLGDVVVPEDPAAATTPLTPGYDQPSSLADQLRWLLETGFEPRVAWEEGDLAVVAARRI